MSVVVLDNTDLVTTLQAEADEAESAQIPKEEPPKEEPKQEDPPKEEPKDDEEDEHGLTAEQKRELSAKMLKAIGKKHREKKEAEEFAAAQYTEKKLAEERANALAKELEALKKPAKVEESARPSRENFQTEDAYLDAVTDWKVDQKLKEKAAEEAKQATERRQAELLETAKQRVSKAIELVPDFKEVTENVDLEVPPVIAGYMQKSELFAELGYHFAKNPNVLVSLMKLPPDEQLVKLGKIESKLQPFSSKDGKEVSKEAPNGATPSGKNGQREAAPSDDETGFTPSKARVTAPVIKPLNSQGSVQSEPDVREMNTREMIQSWQKRNKANFSLRKRH